ncbi:MULTISPECIES: hypothetical protein [unclassified Pseudoxanthomonas]|uniref:hypothetical protein n=1 Tax=unclassified Pseudoxanthomonas TaxID=2645906 RepID=UPI00036DF1D5|nr:MULTISPECIES: hypothetical protein [unclassified Pseudoxanthomonas]
MHESPARQLLPHAVAAVLTAALLALGAWLLLWSARPRLEPGAPLERLQLRLVPRAVLPSLPPQDAARPGPQSAAGTTATGPRQPAAPVPASGAAPARQIDLYDADGRIHLPEGTVARVPVPGQDPLQPPNPVDYRGTRFGDDWISDGDIADVAGQAIARAQGKIARALLGKEIQHAQARRPPQVAFNPARHERPADLGSEATGDAWRAAPISAEPAPGLDGSASRSLREQVAQLEREHPRCPRERMEKLLEPLREALARLQSVEHAMARGADPVRAQHQLPSTADSAWDQGRRALWHARRQLQDCRG